MIVSAYFERRMVSTTVVFAYLECHVMSQRVTSVSFALRFCVCQLWKFHSGACLPCTMVMPALVYVVCNNRVKNVSFTLYKKSLSTCIELVAWHDVLIIWYHG